MTRALPRLLLWCLPLFIAVSTPGTLAFSIGFQPVSQDEIRMSSEPHAPGAPAIILFREVDRDDRGQTGHEDVYFRVKILTEEGRKYADIEIPFDKQEGKVINIHARTIEPDGSIVNFEGKAFTQEIGKARGVKYLAKTFTLPDVRIGSILEYYYTMNLSEEFLFNSHWILSNELFTKAAKFSLKPYSSDVEPWSVRWTWNRLPPGTVQPKEGTDHVISMVSSDIPAFHTEDYMPPENELKYRIDFVYTLDAVEKDQDKFWKKIGKQRNDGLESFVGKRKAMEEAVSTIVSPGDTPDVKLQKIYARVQQIRNTSYENEKTEQEEKRVKEKPAENVEDLWKKQYGSGGQLTWLFLGLARAAGFQASGMWVAARRNYFFFPQRMDANRLDANVVVVKINGKDVFFDPGAAFTPYGTLPWVETGVQGLKLDKDGGSWLETSLPESSASGIRRKAELKLTDTGDLEGKLLVTYTGLEALERRVSEHLEDEAARKKFLEDEVKEAIPAASDVELTSQPDWKSSSPSMVAEFSVKVPGWVSAAGRRALFPVGLFSAPEKHLFDHAEREHPIYFQFPFERSDQITIDLPLGWQISTVPKPARLDFKAVVYDLNATNDKGTLHLNRALNVDILILPVENYPKLRTIFQMVRTDDEQQIVLLPGGSVAGN